MNEMDNVTVALQRQLRSEMVTTQALIAQYNLHAQKQMIAALAEIRQASMSQERLAELLGASTEMVRQIESFEYDLNFTEVRHLALALDSLIEIKVLARNAVEHADKLREEISELVQQTSWSWNVKSVEKSASFNFPNFFSRTNHQHTHNAKDSR